MNNKFPIEVPDYRFDQRNEMFKRRTYEPEFIPYGEKLYKDVKYQDKKGYTKLDYALRNAAWHIEHGFSFGVMKGNSGLYSWDYISPKLQRFVDEGEKVNFSEAKNSKIIKKAAKFLGADLSGICYAHPNLVYSHEMNLVEHKHNPVTIPEGCNNVIVMAVEMNYDLTNYSPDAISGAATGLGYSDQAVLANLTATFIRGLGYKAIPSGNDTALSIPYAIAAGMGELGRSGILITEKYGPRVRVCKVFTDMPLKRDKPKSFGVEKFCEVCKKCADMCPSRSISFGSQTTEGPNISSFSGVKKWYINAEKCFKFWANNYIDCNNCVRSCPFNKKEGKIHDFIRFLIKKAPIFNKLIVKSDDLFGYGKPIKADKKDFWEK